MTPSNALGMIWSTKGAMQEMRGCQMLVLTGKLSLLPLDNVSGMYTFWGLFCKSLISEIDILNKDYYYYYYLRSCPAISEVSIFSILLSWQQVFAKKFPPVIGSWLGVQSQST